MPIVRPSQAVRDCALILTRAQSVVRHACWHDCARSMPKRWPAIPSASPSKARLRTFLGLNAAQVLLTNGVDEAIHLLCSTYLNPEDEALIVVPAFAMYGVFAQAEGARLVQVLAGENFTFPLEEVLSRISPRTRLIAVANPNNPTGAVVECGVLIQIAQSAPRAAVLVDEAYFEFHGDTILKHTPWPANIFVARTFSKAYGLAGLRIGILAGAAEQIAMVRRVASPYNVNAVALAVLPEALRDQGMWNAMLPRCSATAVCWSRNSKHSACTTGQAAPILSWFA